MSSVLLVSFICCYFQYNFYFQISHRCLTNELQRFPVLRKRLDEVIGNFLREGLEPSETIIGHLINIEVGSKILYTFAMVSYSSSSFFPL